MPALSCDYTFRCSVVDNRKREDVLPGMLAQSDNQSTVQGTSRAHSYISSLRENLELTNFLCCLYMLHLHL